MSILLDSLAKIHHRRIVTENMIQLVWKFLFKNTRVHWQGANLDSMFNFIQRWGQN